MTAEPGAHVLEVADDLHAQRAATALWLDRELNKGAKVYYTGWLAEDGSVEDHWVAGSASSPRIRHALDDGQLEFAAAPDLLARSGGTPEGLLDWQRGQIRRALRDGFPSVAMTQETAGHSLTDAAAIAEFARQERGFDVLVRESPLQVRCQLTVDAENATHVRESLGVHFHDVDDVGWSARSEAHGWTLRGGLDAHVARRFAGALGGALRTSPDAEPDAEPDLHVHLGGVDFVDVACAQLMTLAARDMAAGRLLVLHDAPPLLLRLLDALDRPSSLVSAPEVRR